MLDITGLNKIDLLKAHILNVGCCNICQTNLELTFWMFDVDIDNVFGRVIMQKRRRLGPSK